MVHIFLDESGSFGGVETGKPSVSVQGALAIPTKQLDGLFKRYSRLRRTLPKRNGEVKGSLLSEGQVADVVSLLRRYDALFAASIIDLGFHKKEEIERHRLVGIESLSANLTNGHTPELRASIASLQTRMRGFSIPAYAQMMVTVDLLHRFLGEIINYHSQRRPRELADFHWVVDGKAADNIVTDWERWWSDTLVVWLQARSVREPMPLIESANFRYLEQLFMRVPDYLRPFVQPDSEERAGLDLQMIFRKSFRFSSLPEPGLELVDIVTNAVRRALVGNLQERGWLPVRTLMVHRSDIYVRAVGLHGEERTISVPYKPVLRKFAAGGRNMWAAPQS